jgi:hypothetical protein
MIFPDSAPAFETRVFVAGCREVESWAKSFLLEKMKINKMINAYTFD